VTNVERSRRRGRTDRRNRIASARLGFQRLALPSVAAEFGGRRGLPSRRERPIASATMANMRLNGSDDAGRIQSVVSAADVVVASDPIGGESADATICRRFNRRGSLQEESQRASKPIAFWRATGRRARRPQLRSGAKTIDA
jgi:hypothetical protein